jgi:alpha-D-xyloside xylohydrolase
MDGQWTHPEGFAPLDAAPVTWVGDNCHTWRYEEEGIEEALTDILGSARLGYCIIGSDVAGYHGRSNPDEIGATVAATPEVARSSESNAKTSAATGTEFGTAAGSNEIAPNVYIRWAQFSTFCGLFLNGGHGDRRLWKRSQPELEIVRKFSWLHTELVPYIYSHVVTCHNGGLPLMRPLDEGTFHYMFGDDFLVAPIHENKLSCAVSLPPGRWRYLFDDREVLEGPRQFVREFPLDEYPVFIRDGAVVPLKVTRPYTGFGDKESAEFTTWLIYPNGQCEFTLWHPESHPNPESTTVTVDSGPVLKIGFSGKHGPHILRILVDKKPSRITLDGHELPEVGAWRFDTETRRIIIKTRDYTHGAYQIEP